MNNYYPFFVYCNTGQFRNAKLIPGKVKKDPQVHMEEGFFSEPSYPWEQRTHNGYPNVFYDDEYKEYRCYYTTFISDKASTLEHPRDRAGLKYHRLTRPKDFTPQVGGVLMARSDDGIHWERPSLGVCEFDGNKNNSHKTFLLIHFRLIHFRLIHFLQCF